MSTSAPHRSFPSPPSSGARCTSTTALSPRELLLADAIAERVADRLSAKDVPLSHQFVSAAEVARELNVGRQWVYEHAEQLGARRLGDGPRARLRFDLETVRAASVCYASKRSQSPNVSAGAETVAPQGQRGRRLPNRLPEPGSILAVKPRKT